MVDNWWGAITRILRSHNNNLLERSTLESLIRFVWKSLIQALFTLFIAPATAQSWKNTSEQRQVALKVPWWNRNSTIFSQCMGLMMSRLPIFGARSILWAFVVSKLTLLCTTEGRCVQPYSINFATASPVGVGQEVCEGIAHHGEHREVDADADDDEDQREHLARQRLGVG